MVRREHENNKDQYLKRDPGFFLLKIQQVFPAPRAYHPEWYRRSEARGLVGIYYFALRAVLRNKPHLRRYQVRCRHCGIFFLTDPRNAGRTDLGCPFGCAALHRRRESNKRSAAYNRSAAGKHKRKQREEDRTRSGDPPASAGPESPQGDPAASDLAGSTVTEECEPSSHTGGDPVGPLPRDPDPSLPDAVPSPSGGFETSVPGPLEIEISPRMVGYIRGVVSLIEGRPVHQEEVIEMLQRTKRQHSFARERRIDYLLRCLKEQKPP